ncbi:MAG: glycosyltransferase family 2 protein [Candidatus Dojkabacteria bacterium]
MTNTGKQIEFSIIIPLYNEEDSLAELTEELTSHITALQLNAEIIFVNDGSTDSSFQRLQELKKTHISTQIPIIIIDFLTNSGKANALQAGFDHARGNYIFTMDADLQDDPSEMQKFITKMKEENLDMVSGWKFNRLDPASKRLPSKIANGTMKVISGVKIHDMNCGFKLYKASAARTLSLHGDMHRFIPALLGAKKLKVGEVKVNHRKRRYGTSKYGIMRLATSFLDLLVVILRTKFFEKPLHFFGGAGFILFFLSGISLIYLAILWVFGTEPIGDRPLFTFSLISASLGIQIIMIGLLGELLILRTSKREYVIREIIQPNP